MKKNTFYLTLIFLLSVIVQIHAQEFLICTGTANGTGSSTIRQVQLSDCSSQFKFNLPYIFSDITYHPSGKLYGIRSAGDLYELDTITAAIRPVANFRSNNLNSLTSDAQGTIYAAGDAGEFYSYSPQTGVIKLGTIKVLGVPVNAGGDLTFYGGDLYVASVTSLVKINLANPANSTKFMDFNVLPNEIYGIVSFVDCGQVTTYATTGDASGVVYKIDWINRVLQRVCRTNNIIYGGASRYEFRASTVLLDTTRLVSYTCDKTKAAVLPSRILRNQAGCDSVVFESILYARPDTVFKSTITCNRAQVRSDTARFLSLRNCDSVVVTSLKLGTDSMKVPPQRICKGDSVNFYNIWLRQTGTYYKNFTKASGCDSVISIELTVFDKKETVKDTFVCQQNEVRRDTVFLKNFVGCDSFSIRNKLIAPRLAQSYPPIDKRICKGDYVAVGTNRFFTEGLFAVVLKNVYGCDSTINVNVNFLRTDSSIVIAETCDATKLKDSVRVLRNQFGCDSSLIIRPKLIPNTNQINGLPKEVKLNIGDSVELKPQLNFTPVLIQWTPQNAFSCANCPVVFSRVRRSITARFSAKDGKNCVVQQDIKFVVDPNRRVFIPNAFSPNGDPINEIFTIYGDANLDLILTLHIYDRWGETVYSGANLRPNTEGWDGRFKGQVLTPDVFTYWAKLRFKDGENSVVKGDVTLMR
jgi:gliding motility-associated-like protein